MLAFAYLYGKSSVAVMWSYTSKIRRLPWSCLRTRRQLNRESTQTLQPKPCVAQHCVVDERQTAGAGVTMTLIAVVMMHVLLISPGEILTFINQHLLTR